MNSINGILGLVIADALGVPNEFGNRYFFQSNPTIEMKGYGAHKVPAGTWSDDSAMTLATIDSIVSCKNVNVNDLADKFCDWLENAKYTATNVVFDVGNATQKALYLYMKNKKINPNIIATDFGGKSLYDNGNGSLMRILPIAYYAFSLNLNNIELLEIIKKVSSITHAHEISIIGCYIYSLIAINILKGMKIYDSVNAVKLNDYSMFDKNNLKLYDRILKNDISNFKMEEIKSSGYVVDTLEAALWGLLTTDSYNSAVVKAINLGDDTDTVGAVCGGLAGIYYGIENIKKSWKNDLIKIEYVEKLCEKFDQILNKKV